MTDMSTAHSSFKISMLFHLIMDVAHCSVFSLCFQEFTKVDTSVNRLFFEWLKNGPRALFTYIFLHTSC